MISNTSDYLGTPILMNQHIGERESLKYSQFESLHIAIQDGDLGAINDPKIFIGIYKSNYQLYRCIIDKLRLLPTPYLTHPDLLHQLTAAHDNYPQVKDRDKWLEDLEELVTLGFTPDQEINGPLMFGSALDIASERNLKDVCSLFVKLLGRDPKNNELHEAILNDNVEKITSILQNSPSLLFDVNFNRQTPFDFLIELNKLKLLPLFASHCHLLKDKTKNSKKITKKPILRALKKKFYEMAQFLWDLGLDCIELDKYNYLYNFQNKNKETYKQLKIICSNKPKIKSLITACESDDYQTFKNIFEVQPWLMRVTNDNKCPSALAVTHSSSSIINFLHKST